MHTIAPNSLDSSPAACRDPFATPARPRLPHRSTLRYDRLDFEPARDFEQLCPKNNPSRAKTTPIARNTKKLGWRRGSPNVSGTSNQFAQTCLQ